MTTKEVNQVFIWSDSQRIQSISYLIHAANALQDQTLNRRALMYTVEMIGSSDDCSDSFEYIRGILKSLAAGTLTAVNIGKIMVTKLNQDYGPKRPYDDNEREQLSSFTAALMNYQKELADDYEELLYDRVWHPEMEDFLEDPAEIIRRYAIAFVELDKKNSMVAKTTDDLTELFHGLEEKYASN